ncbi:MAG: tRNA (adenosine(37)-N6)-dimethylallyltransferase MiaA [Alphaproteobacteria bacterium]|nr:tRNA (adenosine(37)-N6)-dimethylallyltransferase MiaA [Alphaproteobacteria bacterium]
MKHSAYIIAGPTASGKSDFAHRLACKIGGTIINCDSVQIYRGIENIAASPFAAREITDNIDGVPYRLFSVLPLTEQISVADYLNLARTECESAIGAGRIPIFVGGTGYYINALINGISPMPDVSDASRRRARELVGGDPDAARRLLPTDFVATDPQRVARALEVFFETGHHITEFQNMPRIGAVAPDAYRILISPDSALLRERIAARVPEMLSGGALAEAQLVINSGWDENRAIGASQLCRFIRGEITESECIQNWITKTNQYAKRQRTWFRTQYNPDIIINCAGGTDADIDKII